MLREHPLLTVLGRRGRGALVDVLVQGREETWTVRGLAREAGIPVATAARAVQELEALGAVEVLRPGRDAQVRLRTRTVIGEALARLRLPDLRSGTAHAFVQAFPRPAGVRMMLAWQAPDDDRADPMCPTRIAVICRDDIDPALDAVGAALDAVEQAGWPAPDVTVWRREELEPGDEVAAAILGGRPIDATG